MTTLINVPVFRGMVCVVYTTNMLVLFLKKAPHQNPPVICLSVLLCSGQCFTFVQLRPLSVSKNGRTKVGDFFGEFHYNKLSVNPGSDVLRRVRVVGRISSFVNRILLSFALHIHHRPKKSPPIKLPPGRNWLLVLSEKLPSASRKSCTPKTLPGTFINRSTQHALLTRHFHSRTCFAGASLIFCFQRKTQKTRACR